MWHTKTEVVPVVIERTRKVNQQSPSEQRTPGPSLKDSTPGNNAHPAKSAIHLVMRKKHLLSAIGLWFGSALIRPIARLKQLGGGGGQANCLNKATPPPPVTQKTDRCNAGASKREVDLVCKTITLHRHHFFDAFLCRHCRWTTT